MNSSAAGAVILLYHRVTRLETDPQLLAVTPARFAGQMAVLREIAEPRSLSQIVRAAAQGEDVSKRVAVTFDDGYEDNLTEAAPILRKLYMAATVFVASGGISGGQEFFWDELDRILLQPGRLPARLSMEIAGEKLDLELGRDANYAHDKWERHKGWNVTFADDPTARHRAYREICGLIHRATSAQRRQAISQICEWAQMGSAARPSHRMLTPDQLRELSADGLMEIGAHTVNHPLLSAESPEDQRREIFECRNTLQAILNRPIAAFSYPFGGRRDYTSQSVQAVHKAGFEYACSNFAGQVKAGQDLFQLPRMLVRNWTADEFRERLMRWMQQPAFQETRSPCA